MCDILAEILLFGEEYDGCPAFWRKFPNQVAIVGFLCFSHGIGAGEIKIILPLGAKQESAAFNESAPLAVNISGVVAAGADHMVDFAAKVELLDMFNDHGGHSPTIDGEYPDFGGIIRWQFQFEPIGDCGRISHAGKAMNHELMDGDFSGSEAIFKE